MFFSTMHPLWSTSANLLCYWTSTSTNPCCQPAPGWTPCLPFSQDCRWEISVVFVSLRLLWMPKHNEEFCSLQVLKGDIRPAIETHEMLYQVTKKHNFLPEVVPFFCCLSFEYHHGLWFINSSWLPCSITYCLARRSPLISGFTGPSTPCGQSLQKALTSFIRYNWVLKQISIQHLLHSPFFSLLINL